MRKKKPSSSSFISTIGEIIPNRLDYYVELMEEYGDIVKLPLLARTYLVSNADMIKYVLKDNPENYLRQGISAKPLRLTLGKGLLLLQGAEWKKQRLSLAPLLYGKNITHFAPIIYNTTQQLLNAWNKQCGKSKSFDVSNDILNTVYLVTLKALFGQEKELAPAYLKKIRKSIEFGNAFSVSLAAYLSLPTFGQLKFQYKRRFLQKHVKELIDNHRAFPKENLLNTILNSTHVDSTPLTLQEIQDEITTFLMTGHETTGMALVWAIYLLAQYPEIQAKVKKELSSILLNGYFSFPEVEKLTYTRAVIEETLRLYPPIWTMIRQCQKDDYIGDYFIPKNTHVTISPYVLHRRELYWSNPYEFIPERHLLPTDKKPPLFAFIPFGGGPRICIASHFAMLECTMIIAMLLQRYTFILDESHEVKTQCLISLKPLKGVKIFLQKDQEL